MLTHPTLEKLQALRLTGMVKGLEEQLQMTGLDELGFAERLGLLVDREMTERETVLARSSFIRTIAGLLGTRGGNPAKPLPWHV